MATGGKSPTTGDRRDQEKVCVRSKHDDDDKDYKWVSEDNKHLGETVVKDTFCKHKNKGEHEDDDNAHASKKSNDDGGHANKKDDDNRGHANDDD